MSYSQPDFIVRYRRMRGERVFYPIGFDDNGLPTERYVEQAYGVRAVDLPRAEFVALCLAETRRTAGRYEDLWRRLGLAVDWSLRYSTIDARCQRTAQTSFVTLYQQGYLRRAQDPILWCPEDQTSLAQADVEDLERTSRLHTIRFGGDRDISIATTRPELLPACVALYHHPADARYAGLERATVTALDEAGLLVSSVPTRQVVGVHERCQTPVEFQIRPQWFIAVREHADRFRARAAELEWIPPFMRRRLADWIDGLKWDWNITRQWRYGVPFPVWFCASCDTPVLARLEDLPVDPLADKPPVTQCPACGHGELTGDLDVMDTWMTSSLTPQINDGWASGRADPALAPMSMRVQAFEIIRTWLFYSVVQSELLFGRVPWRTALISGWGLSEQGKKLPKRDLDKSTGPDGYNRYVPADVTAKYGADALRLWATRGRIGIDLRYTEKDVRTGRKFTVKLWNVGRFLSLHVGDLEVGEAAPEPGERDIVDRWVLSHLAEAIDEASAAFETHDYMQAHQAASRMFWSIYCDRYLEMIKDRADQVGTRWTLLESFRALLGLFAPFAPFLTEHMYQRFYREHEDSVSLHLTRWPVADPRWRSDRSAVDQLAAILDATRVLRSGLRLGNSARLSQLVVQPHDGAAEALLDQIAEPLRVAARADTLLRDLADHPSGVPGLTVAIIP
jgi:valyl-tRNA synthetase